MGKGACPEAWKYAAVRAQGAVNLMLNKLMLRLLVSSL